MPPTLLTFQQVAAILGLHPETISRWAAKRKLPVVNMGRNAKRIKESDLEAFIEKRTLKGRTV